MPLPRFWKRKTDEEAVVGSNSSLNNNTSTRQPENDRLEATRRAATTDDATYHLWSPFFLRRLFLSALTVLFIVIGIVLGVLFSQSRQNNGFSTAREGFYYLWTYGPTAVFTAIAALWAQVEYRSKQLMPWNALQRGPQRRDDSLFLDYVDPMNVVSLFRSLRKSHVFVSVAIAGALIVQLMVVLSSGLFEAISVTVVYDNDASLQASNMLIGDYNDTLTVAPAAIYYGKLLYNLSYPLGTTQDYAYQLFNTSHSSVQNISAVVDVFSADLDCGKAAVNSVTEGFYNGLKDNPLIDDLDFVVTTENDARDVSLAAIDESDCSGLIVKIRRGQEWNYNGSYCPQQPEGPDRNRLVILSGTWGSGIRSTLTASGLTTSTAGLIPASLLAEESTTTTRTASEINSSPTGSASATEKSSTINSVPTRSASTAGESTGSSSKDVFIQIEPKTTSSKDVFIQIEPKTTSSSGNDIQLDDPPSDYTIGVNMKRADPTITTSTSTTGSPTVFVLPTYDYTPAYAVVCKPRYTIRKANVTLSRTAGSVDVNTNVASSNSGYAFADMMLLEGDAAEERQLDTLSAWTIMSPVFMSMELSDSQLRTGGLMSFINLTAAKDDTGISESDSVIEGLRQTYRSISAQVVNMYLTRNFTQQQGNSTQQNRTLSGLTVTQETRLSMQAPAFWVTEMALLIAIFGTSFLLLNSPDVRMSRDPGSIGGLATILARSEGLMRLLAGTGAAPLRKIKETVGLERQFAAGIVQASGGSSSWYEFLIEVNDEMEQRQRSGSRGSSEERPKWYRPFAVSLLGRMLIASMPLALIIALEALYQYSARHDGLVDVDDNNRYVHYAWTFIPTLVMVAIGQLFGMLDFATKVFAPYSALCRRGGAHARTSIMENYLDKLGVHALFAALSRKQWAVAATAVATVLSSFLTIVTSGLLNAETAPANYTVTVTQLDNFTKGDDGQLVRYGNVGMVAANLVFASNLTYPQWTYDTLAIPRFELASQQPSNSSVTTTIMQNVTGLYASVPAVRGVANCTVWPVDWFQNCDFLLGRSSLAAVGDKFSPQAMAKFSGNGYFGRWEAPLGNTTNTTDAVPTCPPIVSTFGRAENETVVEATHLACHPYVEAVTASLTVALPDYRILSDNEEQAPKAPPIGHGQLFSNEYWAFVPTGSQLYSLTNPNPRNDTNEDLARLYGLVVWGPDGVPKEELMRDEKRLVSRVETVYAQVLAQVLNEEREWVNGTTEKTKRDAEADSDATTSLTGTILYNGRTRLKQSPISTRILEALLAIMFICAFLAAVLLDTDRVLPKNPCSIAAVASLLAGSELLGSIPQGAEWMSDKQLKERGVFEGKVYSMGWWGGSVGDSDGSISSSGGKRFGIDIGTAVSEKSGGSDAGDGNETKPRWRPAWLRGRAK